MLLKTSAILVNLAFAIVLNCYGQQIIVNGKPSNGKLKWEDFTGKADYTSSFKAYTWYTFKTKTSGVKFAGDSLISDGFQMILELDPKRSWAKMDFITDDLLVHEQGHFNIGILTMNEILKKYKEAKFNRANYSQTLQKIINDASEKYKEMGLKYDSETQHSKNKAEQKRWNEYFAEHLP